MADETSLVAGWIASTLSGDSTLVDQISTDIKGNALAEPAIADTLLDEEIDAVRYVIYHLPGGSRDLMIVGGRTVITEGAWVIKMVGRDAAFSQLKTGAARIKALLHRGGAADNQPAPFPLELSGGRIVSCVRTSIIRYVETDAGIIYRHLGGLYQIAAQSN